MAAHYESFVLRIRRALAERRLLPKQVKIYFIEENDNKGSIVKPIKLNDRGTPDWWPQGIFTEAQKKFYVAREALGKREQSY